MHRLSSKSSPADLVMKIFRHTQLPLRQSDGDASAFSPPGNQLLACPGPTTIETEFLAISHRIKRTVSRIAVSSNTRSTRSMIATGAPERNGKPLPKREKRASQGSFVPAVVIVLRPSCGMGGELRSRSLARTLQGLALSPRAPLLHEVLLVHFLDAGSGQQNINGDLMCLNHRFPPSRRAWYEYALL